MFQNTYPVFEAKRLLKKEMLDNLRDYPRNLFTIQYQNYSDGILFGCELEETRGGLNIMPGILYYKSIPYFLEKPYRVVCEAEGKQAYLKVRFWDKAAGSGGVEYLSQVVVDEQPPNPEHEMELARFKLQPGARLRTEYTDFYDYDTEYDTVNRIHVPYAAPEGSGIWPGMFQCFARAMLRNTMTNPWDHAFCFSCLQLKEAMPYEVARAYLNGRLGQEKEYTNMQIYNSLKSILREANQRQAQPRQSQKKEGTLIML